jgi:hypothetical protein
VRGISDYLKAVPGVSRVPADGRHRTSPRTVVSFEFPFQNRTPCPRRVVNDIPNGINAFWGVNAYGSAPRGTNSARNAVDGTPCGIDWTLSVDSSTPSGINSTRSVDGFVPSGIDAPFLGVVGTLSRINCTRSEMSSTRSVDSPTPSEINSTRSADGLTSSGIDSTPGVDGFTRRARSSIRRRESLGRRRIGSTRAPTHRTSRRNQCRRATRETGRCLGASWPEGAGLSALRARAWPAASSFVAKGGQA